MGTTRIRLQDLADWHRRLGARFRGAARVGLAAGGERCVSIAQRVTAEKGAFNTGAYRGAWRTEPTDGGQRVYNPALYAGVIEFGRRAGRRAPPLKAIAEWALRKLSLTAAAAKAAAFPIARAIARRGIAGRYVARGSLAEMTRAMTDELLGALRRAAAGGA